jgi:pimeloyl-ACP methyl ester carboxylesterase
MRKAILLLFMMATTTAFAQDILGQWDGSLTVQDKTLRLIFHISRTEAGLSATMDSPDQNANGIRMSQVGFENNQLTVELRAAGIKYVGTLDQNTVTGTFTQGPLNIPMTLTKNSATVEPKPVATVETNPLWSESPLQLATKTGTIYGTLTLPKAFGKGPIALIIAGSGPTDRNCNNPSMTNDAYKKLAHELAEKGIASLRYDKRGIAESTAAVVSEASLVFYDYVQDALDWIQLLRGDKRFGQVTVIGHSEGSMIGILASSKADKFVSIAGAGRNIGVVLKEQLSAQPKAVQDEAFPMIDTLTQGKKLQYVSTAMMPLFRPSIQPYMISWLKYDPAVELKKLKIPVLLIQGSTDIQVSVQDARLLSAAKPSAKLLLLDGMNHILRKAPLDREANLATYNDASLPLMEGLVEGISTFVLKQ